MPFIVRCLSVAAALAWLLSTYPAHAWGAVGHRMTGRVAVLLLTSKTKTRLRQIVGTDDLALLSTYMDERRRQLSQALPGSDKWHYDNRPVCDREALVADYCPSGNCASSKIAEFTGILRDERAAPRERAHAVRLLVHILGDIHQPLHAGDNNDRGGNDVRVKLSATSPAIDLHAAWDTDFVNALTEEVSEIKLAAQLRQQFNSQITEAQQGNINDWMQQSYELARAEAYAFPSFTCGSAQTAIIALPPAYMERAQAVIPLQLVRAGARIAHVLNQALDPK